MAEFVIKDAFGTDIGRIQVPPELEPALLPVAVPIPTVDERAPFRLEVHGLTRAARAAAAAAAERDTDDR